MTTTTDYDAPRTKLTAGDGMEELKARRGVPDTAVDADENGLGASFEPSDGDLLDEEFSVAVIPMMADEFRCTRCFLVCHRSQQATGHALCHDCG
jgi:hypothetical protein